jgi:hypothetical protein
VHPRNGHPTDSCSENGQESWITPATSRSSFLPVAWPPGVEPDELVELDPDEEDDRADVEVDREESMYQRKIALASPQRSRWGAV